MRAPGAIVLVGIFSAPLGLAAQRVRDEVVELSNGDRVTGEIKGLDRSYLTFRTIDLGTVQIRWQRVVRLNSNRTLEIVLADGRRLQGSVVSPTPRILEVTGGSGGPVNVDLASIVVIRPVARSWVGNLTGRIDAGFDYTRGSDVADASVNAEVTSRRPAYDADLQRGADDGGRAAG
jgi:small nuclear ribonucleoprotein (snRNP)-like protein